MAKLVEIDKQVDHKMKNKCKNGKIGDNFFFHFSFLTMSSVLWSGPVINSS